MATLQRFLARSPMPVSAAELFAWHGRPGAFQRISPPFEPTRLIERSGGLEVGARTVIEVKMGPLWRRWVAVHTGCVEGQSFTDTQTSGPFARWEHTHRMVPQGDAQSFLEDDVHYALPFGLLGQLGGGAFAEGKLERMFAYRHALTSADLRRHAEFARTPRLHVVLIGPPGELSRALSAFLTTGGHEVTSLEALRGTPALPPTTDAVVHLTPGALSDGQVEEARGLAALLGSLEPYPRTLVAFSRTAYAPGRKDLPLVEESPLSEDARGQRARAYEAAVQSAPASVRVVVLRRGAIVGASLGAGAAGARTAGAPSGAELTVPWISLEDLLGLVYRAVCSPGMRGVFNAVAPSAVPPKAFLERAGVLNEGEGTEAATLQGEVDSGAAAAAGFSFWHPELGGAVDFFRGRNRRANLAGK